ncbi:hypothetical protein CDC7B_1869 [Corynebacterium diphtheriae C7 (beta)]|nr:hypothetical protein CDC7B_1869 [Corynebacterium diphtheriae C7 (beta)]
MCTNPLTFYSLTRHNPRLRGLHFILGVVPIRAKRGGILNRILIDSALVIGHGIAVQLRNRQHAPQSTFHRSSPALGRV